MPTLHLLHGPPGSGKTTYAITLARERRAVRFTHDEWMVTLHGTNPPEPFFREQAAKVFALIWEHAARVLATGTDVVIDAGFWTRASRDEARHWARDNGVECQFYVLQCSLAKARQRVLARTAVLPEGALEITGATFELLAAKIEPLAADEPHNVVQAG